LQRLRTGIPPSPLPPFFWRRHHAPPPPSRGFTHVSRVVVLSTSLAAGLAALTTTRPPHTHVVRVSTARTRTHTAQPLDLCCVGTALNLPRMVA
jgi:hypothetical protein